MARLRAPRGGFRFLALDHGLSHGTLEGIDDCNAVLKGAETAGFSAVVLNPGMLQFISPNTQCGVCVQLYGCPERDGEWTAKKEICSVDDAVGMGADAVSVQFAPFAPDAPDHLAPVAQTLMRAAACSLPSLMMINVNDFNSFSPELLRRAVRTATELGATFVKVPLPAHCSDDDLKKIAHTVDRACLTLLAGGPLRSHFRDLLVTAKKSNFSGVCLGRNFFQARNRSAISTALKGIFP